MNLIIRRKSIYDITLYLIIGQVVLFRFLNIQRSLNKVIIVCEILCFLLRRNKKIHINRFFFLTIGLIIINGIVLGFGETYKSNVLMLLYPFLDILYICWYLERYESSMLSFMNKLCVPLNMYMWINILVMLIQMQGNYFMVGFSDWNNPAYWDLISGLFGYSTTHVVCMFSVFVIVYDLVQIRLLKGNSRLYMKCNLILLAGALSWISLINDNNAFFLVAPTMLLYWIIFSNDMRRVSRFQKIMMGFLLIIGFTGAMLVLFPSIKIYLYDSIFYKVVGAFQVAKEGTKVSHGSMERFAQIFYGLQYLDGWKMGIGLNKSGLFNDGFLGFAHFGNASAGGMVCLAGIWAWISISLAYAECVSNLMKINNRESKLIFVASSLFVVMISMYTTPFTDVSIALAAFFIVVAFWYADKMNVIDRREI